MTQPSENDRNDYIGTGLLSVYNYTFKIFASSSLRVHRRVPFGVPILLVENVGYTVAPAQVGDANGGTITLLAPQSPLAEFDELTIRRRRPLKQETDIQNQTEYLAEQIEVEMDKQIHIDQQQQDALDRSLHLPETEDGTGSTTELPPLDVRKGFLLGFNPTTGALEARPDGPSPAQVIWSVRGLVSLADNPFFRYAARKATTFTKFDITAFAAGVGGDTVVLIKKNGGTVATLTLPAGALFATVSANVSLVDLDLLFPELSSIAPTTPPSTIAIAARD